MVTRLLGLGTEHNGGPAGHEARLGVAYHSSLHFSLLNLLDEAI